MKDERKIGIEFLLYSYFKIDLNATKKEIIKAAIEKAYTDATNQGAYNTKVEPCDKEKSKQAKENAEPIITEFIINSLNGEDYESLHKDVCNDLVNKYKGLPFAYGNAQKWVNMTMKNLYVISLLICDCCVSNDEETRQFCKKICEISSKFHIPIDSYIMEKIWEEKNIELPMEKGKNRTGKYSSEKVKAWSNWDYEQYIDCQRSLKKYIGEGKKPIEWESEAWIEIAKNRKNNISPQILS